MRTRCFRRHLLAFSFNSDETPKQKRHYESRMCSFFICFLPFLAYVVPQVLRPSFSSFLDCLPCFSLLYDFMLSNVNEIMYGIMYELFAGFPPALISHPLQWERAESSNHS
jgi:hypothetical protein